MKKEDKVLLLKLKRAQKIRLAKKSFWEYCKALEPSFYKESRTYLKDFAHTLQDLYEKKKLKPDGTPYRGAIISFPPRHGKSRTMILFATWVLGRENQKSVITISYNADMATEFSRFTRDTILKEPTEKYICFQDVFPDVHIKRGNSSVNKWSLEGSHFSYLGAGFDGSVTGKGATGAMIIDDPIKNAEEALNQDYLDKLYNKYTSTLMSRVEKGALTIIVQTRWSKNDLAGRILQSSDAENFYEINFKAFNEETGEMLCDELLDFDSYTRLKAEVPEIIFLPNYQQVLIDKMGALYPNINNNRYTDLPRDNNGNLAFTNYVAYVDTADKGSDYFATVFAGIYQGNFYVLDMIYTQEPMDKAEDMLLQKLVDNDIMICRIERNFGGGVFARNIERRLRTEYGRTKPIIDTIPQTKNKETRLLLNAPLIQKHVFFPADVHIRFPEAWEHIITFSKTKNKHDDIEDALTGMIESWGNNTGNRPQVINASRLGF